ncbi:hypothetical protein FA95DRAFT_70469 [Auriscalpium vulgare]|uniref:Uncharacterized protein n=1 Tax=Auriscalpium vulgare TaxID=40419 RepID=A0ACB8S7E3_9AGAM|nr:hypothetical protein FA95DRAFT_70469 [Auriscalpium vulgare]
MSCNALQSAPFFLEKIVACPTTRHRCAEYKHITSTPLVGYCWSATQRNACEASTLTDQRFNDHQRTQRPRDRCYPGDRALSITGPPSPAPQISTCAASTTIRRREKGICSVLLIVCTPWAQSSPTPAVLFPIRIPGAPWPAPYGTPSSCLFSVQASDSVRRRTIDPASGSVAASGVHDCTSLGSGRATAQ